MGINRVTIVQSDVNVRALMFALDFAPDVKVGYPAETTGPQIHAGAGITLASLAAAHELGDGNLPPRPFMRQGAGINVQRRGLMVPLIKRLARGQIHAGAFMHTTGLFLKAAMVSAVKRGNFAPLAASTIEAKGSSEILIDSGELIDSLDVHVVR